MAGQLFAQALPAVTEFTSPRAWAFGLLGIHEYLRRLSGDRAVHQIRDSLTARLMELFDRTAQPDWPWFEEVLSYDNAKLAHALILSGRATGNAPVFERGLQRCAGWWRCRPPRTATSGPSAATGSTGAAGPRARFDQQPIEAQAMVSACLEAYRATSDPWWYEQAQRAFDWFLGWNDLGLELYSSEHRRLPRRACTWTGSTRTRARNRRWPSCSRSRKCGSCRTPSPRSTSRPLDDPRPMNTVTVRRSDLVLHPDRTRVLVRPFHPASRQRAAKICAQVMALPESEVRDAARAGARPSSATGTCRSDEFLLRRFDQVRPWLRAGAATLRTNGSCCSARTSPTSIRSKRRRCSIPPSCRTRTSRDLPPGLAAVHPEPAGHGRRAHLLDHLSHRLPGRPGRRSRSTRPPVTAWSPTQVPNASYEKALFARKLQELGLDGRLHPAGAATAWATHSRWTTCAPASVAPRTGSDARDQETAAVARKILLLAESNYEVQFAPDSRLSERVLFPVTPSQSNGIEDARFVRFQNDDGTRTYYATYTAYDGKMILPQFIETPDFLHFKFITLNGPAVQNKGMALFPRKIDGHYAMLGRQDYENIYVMFSDHLHFWHTAQLVLKPTYPVGVHPDGQLRLADRDRSRLARAQPRRRPDAEVLHRRVPARPRRSRPGSSAACASRSSSRTRTSARATCRTSSTPAAASCTAGGSSSPTRCPTTPPPSPPSPSTRCWRRWSSPRADVQADSGRFPL